MREKVEATGSGHICDAATNQIQKKKKTSFSFLLPPSLSLALIIPFFVHLCVCLFMAPVFKCFLFSQSCFCLRPEQLLKAADIQHILQGAADHARTHHEEQLSSLEMRPRERHLSGRRYLHQCVCLPVMCSVLGIIPCKGVDKQSSSCGDTWMATSTGWHALRGCWWVVREWDEDVERGEASGEDGGLSRGLSAQRLPWHCLRLCSMKSKMSARGKREWHWPQVSRSWSPFRGSSGTAPSLGESWESSSGRTPDSGSAAGGGGDKKRQTLLQYGNCPNTDRSTSHY